MKMSRLFSVTQRETPRDVSLPGQQFLIQAGFIRPIGAGIYSLLPLGKKCTEKIKAIIRDEINKIGGQEISMPVVHPADAWKATKRWDKVDQSLVRFKDRHNRDMLIAMTHEEIATMLSAMEIRSYKQLPQLIYQIQTKFRDEARPRGGLIRVREFEMKDSYSFDKDLEGLQKQYDNHIEAYQRIFQRCKLPVQIVESDTGMMGGDYAHEFMYLTKHGEDNLILCEHCGYAANQETALFNAELTSLVETSKLQTFNNESEPLSRLQSLGHNDKNLITVFFLRAYFAAENKHQLLAVFSSAQSQANPVKLMKLLAADDVAPITNSKLKELDTENNNLNEIFTDYRIVLDQSLEENAHYALYIEQLQSLLIGINLHSLFPNYESGDICSASEGSSCVKCNSALKVKNGIEVANIFQFGTLYSAALNAQFTSESGKTEPLVMGSYGIGIGRLLGCLAEHYHDDNGLKLPAAIAPYPVALIALTNKKSSDSFKEFAESFYQQLLQSGIDVIYDERNIGAGIKFADNDLIGSPVRVVISERNYKQKSVEIKLRNSDDSQLIAIDNAIAAIKKAIAS